MWYIVNVEAAICKDGYYLMIVRGELESHAPGMLSFPAGKVEDVLNQEQVLENTLQREIREEVGIEIYPEMAYIESVVFTTDDGKPVVDIVFLCRYLNGTPAINDPGEVAEIHWMTAKEAAEHPRTPPWLLRSLIKVERKRVELDW